MTNDISNLNQVNNIVSLNTFCRWRTMGSRHRYINFKILLIAYFPKSSRANTKWNIKFTDIQRFFFFMRFTNMGKGVGGRIVCNLPSLSLDRHDRIRMNFVTVGGNVVFIRYEYNLRPRARFCNSRTTALGQ